MKRLLLNVRAHASAESAESVLQITGLWRATSRGYTALCKVLSMPRSRVLDMCLSTCIFTAPFL